MPLYICVLNYTNHKFFRAMACSVAESGVVMLNSQSSETRTLTCTIKPRLDVTCPIDFMEVDGQEGKTLPDAVPTTLEPSTELLVDQAWDLLECWDEGVNDPLMTQQAQVLVLPHTFSSVALVYKSFSIRSNTIQEWSRLMEKLCTSSAASMFMKQESESRSTHRMRYIFLPQIVLKRYKTQVSCKPMDLLSPGFEFPDWHR